MFIIWSPCFAKLSSHFPDKFPHETSPNTLLFVIHQDDYCRYVCTPGPYTAWAHVHNGNHNAFTASASDDNNNVDKICRFETRWLSPKRQRYPVTLKYVRIIRMYTNNKLLVLCTTPSRTDRDSLLTSLGSGRNYRPILISSRHSNLKPSGKSQ